MVEFKLNIQGYYRDEIRGRFPNIACVYFVYRGVLNLEDRTCSLKELIYIGQTSNLNERFSEHEKREDFLSLCERGEMLFYTYAEITSSENSRKHIEAALIYELRPQLNVQAIGSFDYPKTRIIVEGNRHAFVPASIIAPSY
jgi:hypothetical protein